MYYAYAAQFEQRDSSGFEDIGRRDRFVDCPSTKMSLFAGSIFRLATSSSRFSRTFSAASRAFAQYGDRAPSPVSNRLFISLNFDTTENDLRAACEKYGDVLSNRVIKDR